jgi:hypothetical protein
VTRKQKRERTTALVMVALVAAGPALGLLALVLGVR